MLFRTNKVNQDIQNNQDHLLLLLLILALHSLRVGHKSCLVVYFPLPILLDNILVAFLPLVVLHFVFEAICKNSSRPIFVLFSPITTSIPTIKKVDVLVLSSLAIFLVLVVAAVLFLIMVLWCLCLKKSQCRYAMKKYWIKYLAFTAQSFKIQNSECSRFRSKLRRRQVSPFTITPFLFSFYFLLSLLLRTRKYQIISI